MPRRPVHPGPPGQLMMAAALLKELGADGFVSSVSISMMSKDAAGLENVHALAGAHALPPPGFTIESKPEYLNRPVARKR